MTVRLAPGAGQAGGGRAFDFRPRGSADPDATSQSNRVFRTKRANSDGTAEKHGEKGRSPVKTEAEPAKHAKRREHRRGYWATVRSKTISTQSVSSLLFSRPLACFADSMSFLEFHVGVEDSLVGRTVKVLCESPDRGIRVVIAWKIPDDHPKFYTKAEGRRLFGVAGGAPRLLLQAGDTVTFAVRGGAHDDGAIFLNRGELITRTKASP